MTVERINAYAAKEVEAMALVGEAECLLYRAWQAFRELGREDEATSIQNAMRLLPGSMP